MKMKKSIILFVLFVIYNHQLKAQCEIPLLSIKDSLSVKALRGFIEDAQQRKDANLLEKLVDKKTQYVILSETRRCISDGLDRRMFSLGVCDNNHYKHFKYIINGYFYLDNVLYLVMAYSANSLQTSSYDYGNQCLKNIFSSHTLKEYVPDKRVKVMRNNAEAEMIVRGDRMHLFGCNIILGVKTEKEKDTYQLLYQLD